MPALRLVDQSRWAPLAASALAAAVLCGVLAYWAMVLLAPRVTIAPAETLVESAAPSDLGPVQRLFGQVAGAAAGPAELPPANVQVLGIVAGSRQGSAILSVDGSAPRAYGIGDTVAEGLRLTSVSAREVVLERNGVKLRAPAPPAADLAVLTRGWDPAGTLGTSAAVPPGALPPLMAPSVPPPAPAPPPTAAPPPAATLPPAAAAPAGTPAPVIAVPAPPPGTATATTPPQRGVRRGRSSGGDEE